MPEIHCCFLSLLLVDQPVGIYICFDVIGIVGNVTWFFNFATICFALCENWLNMLTEKKHIDTKLLGGFVNKIDWFLNSKIYCNNRYCTH